MRKILSVIIALCFSMQASAVNIYGEDTNNEFIQSVETEKGVYFLQCYISPKSKRYSCRPLLGEIVYFSRVEIDDLAAWNAFKATGVAVADVFIVGAAFVFGMIGGAHFTAGLGASYAGAPSAVGGFLASIGTTSIGMTANFAFDSLDPFVHNDISSTFEAVNGTAGDFELSAVNGVRKGERNELFVSVEDLTFQELRQRLGSQLADIKNMDFE